MLLSLAATGGGGNRDLGDVYQQPVAGCFILVSVREAMKSLVPLLSIGCLVALDPAHGFNVPSAPPPLAISLQPAFTGASFNQPVCLASPPGDTKRLFVCQKGGLLRVIPDVTVSPQTATTFLDVTARPGTTINAGGEMGLLGLAFHPNYASNRKFYVFYSINKGGVQYERVSCFLRDENNPNVAVPGSEVILIEQGDEASNHNGGCLQFGADGYLYISVGDEGNQNDSFNNSQRIDKDFFSGILRIDVDMKTENKPPNPWTDEEAGQQGQPSYTNAIPTSNSVPRYYVPVDNPFVHTSRGGQWNGTFNGATLPTLTKVRDEFWAVGLRNPWRFSFDAPTGELWCGDVGGGAREEVNLIVKGGNYGWAYREGTTTGPKSGSTPANFTSLPPLKEYNHGSGTDQGNSITGGVVYRGARFGALYGAYIYADHTPGNVWSLVRNPTGPPTVTRISGEGGITAFGTDPSNGDVLLADLDGPIHRLVSTPVSGDTFPATLTATQLFSSVTNLTPAPELLPYSVNLPFWSDHAVKRRWFHLPAGLKMTWSQDNPWTLPTGAFWVKHFDLNLQRNPDANPKRIETRLFVKTATGAYGVSYKWNAAGTEANLVADEGEDFNLTITDGGTPKTQRWHIPSRSECMTCHTPAAGHALSFNTRQLNLDGPINGTGNQLSQLVASSLFTNAVPSPNLLPRHFRPDETAETQEARVRSYLAVNCSYCHQPGTTTANWDGRAHLTLDQTGLINGAATNNGGDPLNKLVVPGDTAHSIIYNRVGASNGFSRMPPLATNELDTRAVTLLGDWIGSELPSRQNYAAWRSSFFGNSANGDPTADPDKDGRNNREEYIAGTSPSGAGPYVHPTVTLDGTNATVSFPLPAHRSFQVERSADLVNWTPWDIPGNGGLSRPGGTATLTGPVPAGDRHFFRVLLKEN